MASIGENNAPAETPEEREARRREALSKAAAEVVDIQAEIEAKYGPDWPLVLVLELVRISLTALRDSLKDGDDPAISWTHPWAELRIPADWNFDAPRGEQAVQLKTTVPFPPEGEEDKFFAELTRVRYAQWEQAFLSSLTNHVVVSEKEDGTALWVPDHLRAKFGLDALPDKARDDAVRFLARPFSFGAVEFDLEAELQELAAGEEKPLHAADLADLFDSLQPAVRFTAKTEEGYEFGFGLFFQLSPLTVLEGPREAFFRATTGLQFWPLDPEEFARVFDDRGGLEGWLPPGFDDETAADLWEAIFQGLDELLAGVRAHQDSVALVEKGFAENLEKGFAERVEDLEVRPAARPEDVPFFPSQFGHARMDVEVANLISHVHQVRLPARKWSSLPSWPELQRREVERILEEVGDLAFEDLRRTTNDPEARGPLLLSKFAPDGTPRHELTKEAETRLKIREGLNRGFRYLDPRTGKEYFLRMYQMGSGYLEVGFSWFNAAGPWLREWREDRERELEAALAARTPSLFKELDAEAKERVDALVRDLNLVKDSHRLMEAILGQVSVQGATEVEIPAFALRVLLGLENDKDWKSRLERGLEALRACEFRAESTGTNRKVRAYGSFIGEWRYLGAGKGAHGAGVYTLFVQPGFVGCLKVFETDRRKLPANGTEVLRLDFTKTPSEDEKAAAGWGYDRKEKKKRSGPGFITFDAGRPYYNRTAGFTPEQEKLHAFVEGQITLRSSAVSARLFSNPRRRAEARPHTKAADANGPRIYTSEECPLLEPGKRYHGALGNFRSSPEAGRRLSGTPRRASATGGAHKEGLLEMMGLRLLPGRALRDRRRTAAVALENMKAVVEDYLGGVVAARLGDRWLKLEEAASLGEKDLLHKALWFLFVPEDWTQRRHEHFERTAGWRVSLTKEEALLGRRATVSTKTLEVRPMLTVQRETAGRDRPANVGLEGLDLFRRLHAARRQRGLTQATVGGLFGVSQKTVALWEAGTEPDDDGKVRGKPIAEGLVPLVLRWVETGEAPTAAELASRRR